MSSLLIPQTQSRTRLPTRPYQLSCVFKGTQQVLHSLATQKRKINPLPCHSSAGAAAEDDDEVDPLDAFMAGIEATVAKEKTVPEKAAVPKPRRDDLEDADDQGAQPLQSGSDPSLDPGYRCCKRIFAEKDKTTLWT